MQEGTGSVRFISVPDFSKIVRFGSVRFGKLHFPVRRGSACVFRTRRGSVQFGSVRFRVRFRPVPKLKASVRFGLAGSVRFLIPSCQAFHAPFQTLLDSSLFQKRTGKGIGRQGMVLKYISACESRREGAYIAVSAH